MPALLLALLIPGAPEDGAGPEKAAPPAPAGPVHVDILPVRGGYLLRRNGEPYRIKGVGGTTRRELAAACGANSLRTWGTGAYLDEALDDAHARGLTVVVGLWLGHPRHGFDYGDAAAVARQADEVLADVRKYRSHPAVLLWGLGNEAEGFDDGDDPRFWRHVEDLAGKIHGLDPHHPVMTVLAGAAKTKVAALHRFAPSVDVVGMNMYRGAEDLPRKYRAAGGRKPYVLSEFAAPGPWQVEPNDLGAIEEPTSTAKADAYADIYKAVTADPACLGCYAFKWGAKVEATTTWVGMLLPDGSRLGCVDALARQWGGGVPNRCPRVRGIGVRGPERVEPGAVLRAVLLSDDPEGDPLTAEWELRRDSGETSTGGDARQAPPLYAGAVKDADASGATVTMPAGGGLYRLYAVVRDGYGGAATANLPLRVDGVPAGAVAARPLLVQHDDREGSPYAPSAWMGNKEAVTLDTGSTDDPRRGERCIEVTYAAADGWAAVAWRHPAGDWGSEPGGYDLTGATRLTVWARGERGGERVNFGVGGVGMDKPFPDSAEAAAEFTLTDQWKQYEVDLTGRDLSRLKTGFKWVVSGQGRPVTFYLDDPRIE